ncbi:MAG: nucleotide exchange factor GrpE [Planctomycetota bacterium]|nr:nucleotide exchange factor GrpE [Planctomycetota bacterium]
MADSKAEKHKRKAKDAPETDLEKLNERIDELEKKAGEFEGLWKRALADLQNYRKRFDREVERIRISERKEASGILLEVLDNLERAVENDDGSSPFKKGIEAILDHAFDSLLKLGVRKVPAVGEKFDPMLHTAIEIVEGEENNVVIEQQRAGYMVGDHLLRPAYVVVSRKSDKSGEDATADSA